MFFSLFFSYRGNVPFVDGPQLYSRVSSGTQTAGNMGKPRDVCMCPFCLGSGTTNLQPVA